MNYAATTRSVRRGGTRRQQGSSYVEVIVAALLLAICLAPAIDSVTNAVREGGTPLRTTRSDILCVKSHLESVMADPYSVLLGASLAAGSLSVASSYSLAATTACPALQVYLAPYDADQLAYPNIDTGLLLIKVTSLDNTVALSTLATRE